MYIPSDAEIKQLTSLIIRGITDVNHAEVINSTFYQKLLRTDFLSLTNHSDVPTATFALIARLTATVPTIRGVDLSYNLLADSAIGIVGILVTDNMQSLNLMGNRLGNASHAIGTMIAKGSAMTYVNMSENGIESEAQESLRDIFERRNNNEAIHEEAPGLIESLGLGLTRSMIEIICQYGEVLSPRPKLEYRLEDSLFRYGMSREDFVASGFEEMPTLQRPFIGWSPPPSSSQESSSQGSSSSQVALSQLPAEYQLYYQLLRGLELDESEEESSSQSSSQGSSSSSQSSSSETLTDPSSQESSLQSSSEVVSTESSSQESSSSSQSSSQEGSTQSSSQGSSSSSQSSSQGSLFASQEALSPSTSSLWHNMFLAMGLVLETMTKSFCDLVTLKTVAGIMMGENCKYCDNEIE